MGKAGGSPHHTPNGMCSQREGMEDGSEERASLGVGAVLVSG